MALIAAYNFNEGSGTTSADKSGNGHGVTATGSPWTATGHTLAGARCASAVPGTFFQTDAVLQGSTLSAYTYMMWAKMDADAADNTSAAVIADSDNAFDGPFVNMAVLTASVVRFQTPISSNSGLNRNQWYHLAVTCDGATNLVYVDGVLQTTVPGANPLNFNHRFKFALNSGTPVTGMSMDDLRFYSHALTQSEVVTAMGTPVPDGPVIPPTTLTYGSVSDYEHDYYVRRGGDYLLSLSDLRRAYRIVDDFSYWSGLSGLVPAQAYSQADHMRKAMMTNLGLTEATYPYTNDDLSKLYYATSAT